MKTSPANDTPASFETIDILQQLLTELRDGDIQPAIGLAIAATARELRGVVNLQLRISEQAARPVPEALLRYADVNYR